MHYIDNMLIAVLEAKKCFDVSLDIRILGKRWPIDASKSCPEMFQSWPEFVSELSRVVQSCPELLRVELR